MMGTEGGAGAREQTASATGAGSTAYNIGGDFQVHETHVHAGAVEFLELDAADVHADEAPLPTPELAARLKSQRVVLLAGESDEKPVVARHVAAWVANEAAGAGAPPALLEWNGAKELDALLRGLRSRKERAVILLLRLEPKQVDWRLTRVREEAVEHGHFVVATTEVSIATWQRGADDAGFLVPVADAGLYDASFLVKRLVRELTRTGGALSRGLIEEDEQDVERSRLCGITFRAIAERLQLPSRISSFVARLVREAGERGQVDQDTVRRLLKEVTDACRRVERWFQSQGDAAQLLALGLSLFEGVPDDQFFAAMESWVTEVRARRDPTVRAFDYRDASELEAMFPEVPSANGTTRYEPRWPGQRRSMLQAGWKTHRRQIVGALDVLARIARESALGRGQHPELFGSESRRRKLREVVTESLSEVGLLSAAAVEPRLLELASDDDTDVQEVAAGAVARWRGNGADAQFFELVARWQEDARIRGIVESLLGGRDETRNEGPMAQIRSTIALAVGAAAAYDPPDQLKPELRRLLLELARDDNRLVRQRFAAVTLPAAAGRHLRQLRGFLRDLANDFSLTQAVGAALAYAVRTLPEEVRKTLDAWQAECTRDRPASVNPRRLTHRDKLVMALAFTYGEMEYGEDAPLTMQEGFARLQEILRAEAHPKIRSAVVLAVGRQARRSFGVAEPLLQRLMDWVSGEELGQVVRSLSDVYLDQRLALDGGEDEVAVGGTRYAIWIDRARPVTEVEVAMIRWVNDGAHPVAQRVGMLATLNFVERLDRFEDQRIAKVRAERARRAADDAAARIANAPEPLGSRSGWYTGGLVPWLATIPAPYLFVPVRGLLPEALAQRMRRGWTLGYVLDRWERMRGDSETSELARRLRSAMFWQAAAGFILGFLGFALFLLFVTRKPG